MLQDLINGYSLALYSLAIENKKIEEYKKQASEIIEALKGNEEYLQIISSKRISTEQKEKLISSSLKGINKDLKHFVLLVAHSSKALIIPKVLEKMIKLINEKLGVKEGVVYSPEKLSAAQIKSVEKSIKGKLGFIPTLTYKLDKELISGIKVVIGDIVIEDSIHSRLDQIRQELLLKGGM